MVQQQNMRSIWRSRKASGGTFPHLRDERQNQKDRMYKSESRGEGERAINGSASEAEAAALCYERATRAKNTCVYSVYVFLIQQGTFSKQRITILSQNPNSIL